MEKRHIVGFFIILIVSSVLQAKAGAQSALPSLKHETSQTARTVNHSGVKNSEKSWTRYPAQISFDTPPFGEIDFPMEGSTVSGAIIISGWVVDDNYGVSVKIYRKSGASLIYIGDAFEHSSLRPDLQQVYPEPQYYPVGWQYWLLTNFFSDQSYSITAIATDAAGQQDTLGTRSLTFDNANRVKPFGTIDTPTQGGNASGENYVVWAWALTAHPNTIPTDGSTIDVLVDGTNLGHPTYNIYKSDIATLFPGYNNSDGAAGYFRLNTTTYEDGLHTLSWSVTDDAQNQETIGSRYFYIQNGPRIDVRGNGNIIANGDTLPSETDSTYFGTVEVDAELQAHTFTIWNTGKSDLNLTGSPIVSVTGTAFTVDVQPTGVIPSQNSATFDIFFDPVLTGYHSAVVRIESDDTDQDPYTFGVGGYGFVNQDSLSLVALYESTDGANWTNNTNWLTGPISDWFGITTTGNRVTKIVLYNNNLNGVIPPEIGNLDKLERLELWTNSLSDTIPSEICNLKNLYQIRITGNQLTGPIPEDIGNLTELNYLALCRNELSESIPASIGQLGKLQYLDLGSNEFSGSIPLEICDLTSLAWLDLGSNQLAGTIPPEIGNLTELYYLDLSFNQLTGSISSSIGSLVQLENLYLSLNQLEGPIPSDIGDLSNLIILSLYGNQLTGAVPASFNNLSDLFALYLYSNQLTDMVDLSDLDSLTYLQIQDNRFTFEDIEPNIGIDTFVYAPQDSVGETQDTTVSVGDNLSFSVNVGGSANLYQWMKDDADIAGADSSVLDFPSVLLFDAGTYICKITNTIAIDLTLYSRPIQLTVENGVGVADRTGTTPKKFNLTQNYPNPFNPNTKIRYDVKNPCHVSLKVYNINGQEVCDLINSFHAPGSYEVEFHSENVSSGLYFYKIQMGKFHDFKKMIKLE